ncbi:MAG TPA: EAL domain-containing protein [Pyrinomonadaceae bacterium]|jgi:diguanylate cyclase (GGDEF)-like protein/PAS domain S-box-containing protein
MSSNSPQRFAKPLIGLVIALGAGIVLFSASGLSAPQLDVTFLLFAVITIQMGTRILIQIPQAKGYVPLSDAFVLLGMLLFDGEAAVVLAAVAALCGALRMNRRGSALLSDSMGAAIPVFLIVWILRFSFGSITDLGYSRYSQTLLLAVCVAALMQSATCAWSIARSESSEWGLSFWKRWFRNYAWTFVTYFALTSAAGVVVKLIEMTGIYPFVLVVTILAIIHFAYTTYLKNKNDVVAHAKEVEQRAEALEESEELFRSAFDHAAIGMAMVSSDGRWLRVNMHLCAILGYTEQELLEMDFQSITHPDDLGVALVNVARLLKEHTQNHRMEKRYIHKQGHEVWVLWSVARVRDLNGDAVRLIFQIQDITDRKQSEERLLHDAFHDALTGLPNRALFIDHLKLTIARTKRRENQMFAVLFLDLDRFKVINDSLGHMLGDQLLIGIARRLEACLRQEDTVSRVGGDEFTILLEDIQDETEAIMVAERIHKELATPFNLDGHEVFTTVSIGIAPSSTGYDHPEEIMRDADTAMYRAKSLGKARHEVFDKAMHAFAVNLLQLETDLRRALERHEFFIQYQPIVALDTFQLRGFEALVRWQHPERGLISPMDFIPIAEDTGQIISIGLWTLEQACRQMRQWQKQFPSESLFISVNLSGKQFTQPDLIEQVRVTLESTKLDPRSLKLEITESVVMENIDTATEMLRQLRALGVQLSIDDFGTGYSSLSYLHRFPIDTLKIDRSFVMRMVDNSENIEIVRTIVMLAQILGMDVVAEGVETKEQLALLRKLGCENGQGYFFSKPTGVGGAEKIIADTCAHLQAAPDSSKVKPAEPIMVDNVKNIRAWSIV